MPDILPGPDSLPRPDLPPRMPAEWETQDALWLAWPHNLETWPDRFDPIPGLFADWVTEVAPRLPVRVIASGVALADARRRIGGNAEVEFFDIPTNDCWIRDYGPTFVHAADGSVSAVDWQFNAWGGKYPPWDEDNAASGRIARAAGLPLDRSELCLEGGAIETDGGGRLLTTPDCILSATRNTGWSPESVARELHRRLGVTEIVWIDGGGLVGDDTDGHIDQLARFVDRQNVVVAVCDDREDPNHGPLEENYRQLRLWGTSTDPKVQVHRLPIPPARFIGEQRVPESYCNFLRLGPDRLLMPSFDAFADDATAGLLAELTGATVTGIPCSDLAWGLGALHCASRDQPAAAPPAT